MNAYADVGMFRREFVDGQTLDAIDQTQILKSLEAGSRRVDSHTRREFYASYGTKVFHSCGESYIRIPDLLSAEEVGQDSTASGTFAALDANDYVLEREFAPDIDADPKTVIRLETGTFPAGKRVLQIEGLWGYTNATETLVAQLNGAINDSVATVTVDADHGIEAGQTLLLGAEQVYVESVATNDLTVTRAANGTTAASHLDNAAINRYVYTPEVVQATLIYAGRLWKRREAAYANVISNEVSGTTSVFRTSDPDVEGLLSALVRWSA